ncbi:MAG TPA: hypothetical protein VFC38_03020 [Stellaceae bacterium]|nr:hypothetical protein [Stellaceae bacterium]
MKRIPMLGLVLAAVPILISHGISHAASEQAIPAPGLSPQALSHYQEMLKGLSPETVNSLITEALMLVHTYAGAAPGSTELQELKQHKGELQDLKTRLCATVLHC